MEGTDVAQRTRPPQVRGRLAQTVEETVQLHARQRVDTQRQATYRRARKLTGDVLELVDQLDAERDPSERLWLQESARGAAGRIVRLLAGVEARVPTPKRTTLSLDQAMEQLDAALGLAAQRLTGSRYVALELALIVQAGVDDLAGVQSAEAVA
jgi:hypothetical protein